MCIELLCRRIVRMTGEHPYAAEWHVGECVLAELGFGDAAVVGCLCDVETVFASEIRDIFVGHA